MNENYQQEILRLSEDMLQQSKNYSKARKESAISFSIIKLELAKAYSELKGDKKIFGYDLALIMLRENANDELLNHFKIYEEKEAEYKGLEKILEALKTRIMAIQSVMKYDLQGEYGNHE